MYKYSRGAQDTFFDRATFAFLFAWFEASPRARAFTKSKCAENMNAGHEERVTDEIAELGLEAQLKLRQGHSDSEHMR